MDDRQPIFQALKELSEFCQGFQPTELTSFPTVRDAQEITNDMLTFAGKVDRVIAAYGAYADSYWNGVDLAYFSNQLRNALTGNATFEIEDAAEAAAEDEYEYGRV